MKKYCFIDMHIHSIFSNEAGCTKTPGKILDNVYQMVQEEREKDYDVIMGIISSVPQSEVHKALAKYYALESQAEHDLLEKCLEGNDIGLICERVTKNFVKACISITDHNSILGSTEALRIISEHPEKYSCIDFVPGIEFNAGLKELGLNSEGKSIYSKCHILGYGFDPQDKNMRIFSELFQLSIGRHNNINIGHSICAVRNELRTRYGKVIPMEKLEPILEYGKQFQFATQHVNKSYNEIRKMFYDVCKQYLTENQFRTFVVETEAIFPTQTRSIEENVGRGKLAISEIAKMIAEAGGKLAIAHPTIITQNKKMPKTQQEVKALLDDLIPRIQSNTGYKVDAVEAYHANCSDFLEVILQAAQEHRLYLTGGSDHHGDHLYPENRISRCFGKGFEYNSVASPIFWPNQIKNQVVSLAILDEIFDKPFKHHDLQHSVIKRVDRTLYSKEEIIRISNCSYRDLITIRARRSGQRADTRHMNARERRQHEQRARQNNRQQNSRQRGDEIPFEYPFEPEVEERPVRESNLMEYQKQWKPDYIEQEIQEMQEHAPDFFADTDDQHTV